jgi:glycosyltransferase involved in cell wall biosynthesis
VLPLGIHAAGTADLNRPCKEAPTILWNHRWEFDKAPDYFRNVLLDFKKHKMPFSLILTGEQFDSIPPPLLLIQEEFHQEILHQGYAKSREEYEALLDRSDFVIHSPKQENFGISVLEAMSKGVIPLLGEGTAYDDWCEGSFITSNPTTIRERFVNYADNPAPYRNLAKQIAKRFDWDKVIPLYNEATNEIVNS